MHCKDCIYLKTEHAKLFILIGEHKNTSIISIRIKNSIRHGSMIELPAYISENSEVQHFSITENSKQDWVSNLKKGIIFIRNLAWVTSLGYLE